MAKQASVITQIQKLIAEIEQERQKHVDAVAEIDATLGSLGAAAAPVKRTGKRGRPKGSKNKVSKRVIKKKAPRRKRQTFKVTGEESILAFVTKAKNPPNAKEINQYWTKEGRGGKADNTIGKLVKDKKIMRVQADGERGSRYKIK